MPAKPTKTTRQPQKAPPAKPAAKSKPTSKPKSKKSHEPLLPPLPNLSAERKVDLVGAVMALVGLLTMVALASSTHGGISEGWLGFLQLVFGWGAYILPIALILLGGWLVLRKVERLPRLSAERLTGLTLFFFFLLGFFQMAAGNPDPLSGQGGGYIGSIIYRLLQSLLGDAGLLVTLLAWGIISVILILNISMQEIFDFFSPLLQRISQPIQSMMNRGQPSPTTSEFEGDFIPINRASLEAAHQATPSPAPVTPGVSVPQGAPSPITNIPIVWKLPQVKDILELGTASAISDEYIQKRALLIEETLASFGAPAQVVEINCGPSVTQFGVEPLFVENRSGRIRVRVSKIVSLADDLALALAAPRIRIQAPVPGRSYVGIEVPNEEMTLVTLREILETESFSRGHKSLSFALGRDVAGHPSWADLGGLPHLLIAGTTGSGKSVCVNSILISLLMYNTPDDLRIILVDPKRVELTGYNGIPHLLSPVVVEMDRVIGALQWMTREMDKRYHEFAQVGARNIQDYNTRMKTQGGKKIPNLVVIIDELADLMMLAPDETERTITRLAQLARATGIHLILATQRPSVDVVTGLIKANFPARIAFAVASNTDSRVILDQPGAERLLGRGDMLYQSPDAPSPVRLQGVFVSDGEIHDLVNFWRAQAGQVNAYNLPAGVDSPPSGIPLKQTSMFEDMSPREQGDPLMEEAIDLIRREGRASVSMLQRRLRIGYTRAARLVDTLEDKGIIGPPQDATGVRPVLDYGQAGPPIEDR